MESNNDRDTHEMMMRHEQSIIKLEACSKDYTRRIEDLETTRGILTDIKIALSNLTMGNANMSEKFNDRFSDLKASIAQISKDNLEQHNSLSGRIKIIEDGPAKKWEMVVLVVITALVSGFVGYFVSTLLPKV